MEQAINQVSEKSSPKLRIGSLDLFKIFCALVIVFYHSIANFGCDYGIANPFFEMGSVFMTAFFVLSGFCIFYSTKKMDTGNVKDIFKFYLKRVLTLFPLYYIVAIIVVVFFTKENPQNVFILLPFELLGLQSAIPGLRFISHNAGTWFVSCIFICYLLYPLVLVFARKMKNYQKFILIGTIASLLMFAPVVEYRFNLLSLYDNAFFRFGEFAIGVLLSSMLEDFKNKKFSKYYFNVFVAIFLLVVQIFLTYVFFYNHIDIDKRMYYEVFSLPLFAMMIFALGGVSNKHINKSKVLKYIAMLCYPLYLVQLLSPWAKFIVDNLHITNNVLLIISAFVIYVLFAVIANEVVQRPMGILTKYLFKKIENKEESGHERTN